MFTEASSGLREIRCYCNKLLSRMRGEVAYEEYKCPRCHALVEVMGHTVVSTTSSAMLIRA